MADGEDVDADLDHVLEDFLDLVFLLADAEHDAGLGDEAARLGVFEHPEGAVVAGGLADRALEALDRLEVVVENVRAGVEDDVEVFLLAAEVGRQHFDRALGHAVVHGADGGRPDGGAAVLEVVAGDGGDDGVLQIHAGDRLGHAGGLAEVELGRAAGLYRAKGAGTGADVTQNHDGGGATAPAFAHVRALSTLAYGVQTVRIDDLAHLLVFVAGGELGAEPIWFPVMHLDE